MSHATSQLVVVLTDEDGAHLRVVDGVLFSRIAVNLPQFVLVVDQGRVVGRVELVDRQVQVLDHLQLPCRVFSQGTQFPLHIRRLTFSHLDQLLLQLDVLLVVADVQQDIVLSLLDGLLLGVALKLNDRLDSVLWSSIAYPVSGKVIEAVLLPLLPKFPAGYPGAVAGTLLEVNTPLNCTDSVLPIFLHPVGQLVVLQDLVTPQLVQFLFLYSKQRYFLEVLVVAAPNGLGVSQFLLALHNLFGEFLVKLLEVPHFPEHLFDFVIGLPTDPLLSDPLPRYLLEF